MQFGNSGAGGAAVAGYRGRLKNRYSYSVQLNVINLFDPPAAQPQPKKKSQADF